MKEEYDRLIEAERVYRNSIANEVKGSARIKHIGNKEYLYLEKRDGAKVVYEYIGAADCQKAQKTLESIKKRKKDQLALNRILKDLKEVRKVLRGKI